MSISARVCSLPSARRNASWEPLDKACPLVILAVVQICLAHFQECLLKIHETVRARKKYHTPCPALVLELVAARVLLGDAQAVDTAL